MPSAFFNAFKPDPDELLRRISRHVDEAMLQEIAEADYDHDVDEHRVQLRRIRDSGSFETPMGWHPAEVLELIRWSQPENPQWRPGATGERGHWMRAFACAALLKASGDVENESLREDWNETPIQFIDSLRLLGPEFDEPASAFLAWLILKFEADAKAEDLGFLAVGLLWFGLRVQPPVADDIIIALSEWIAAREQRFALDCGHFTGRLQLGSIYGSRRRSAWERLGTALVTSDLGDRSAAAKEWVALLGSELAGAKRVEGFYGAP